MEALSPEGLKFIEELARKYEVSVDAVKTLLQAVISGHGTMAQFSHPELGGPGQWSRGGMTMVGDMFNNALKAKVDGLCSELASMLSREPSWTRGTSSLGAWWGADLGTASATGSQNNIRYAYFPASRRLAVAIGDRVTLYDTEDHIITGVSQQQSADASLSFNSQHGLVRAADLRVVGPEKQSSTVPPSETRKHPDDDFSKLERLAELHKKGILSNEEYATKKTELLGRL
jgi:hypothetical protein